MSETTNGAVDRLDAPRFYLRLAAGFGLLTGLGEVALFAAQRYLLHIFIFVGRDVVWMAPLADLLVFLLAGLLLVLLARTRPGRETWRIAVGALAFLAFVSLLLMYTPLHRGAAIILAAGLAVQTFRMCRGREAAALAFARFAPAVVLLIVVLLASIVKGKPILAERRGLARLPAAPAGAPNVLFLIWDTARASSLSAYGYSRPTTPALDSLSETAVRFDLALANAPWTLPSHASFFTGHLPHELSANWLSPLDTRYPTLAEALRDKGYATAGFVGNLLYCDPEKGLDRGFLHYEDYIVTPGRLLHSSSIVRNLSGLPWLRVLLEGYDMIGRKPAPEVNREFLAWLDRRPNRPFFVFLNFFDAHAPYLPPEPYASRFHTPGLRLAYSPWVRYRARPAGDSLPADWLQDNVDRYDAMLAYLDENFRTLMAELNRRGLLQNTVVILASDHGEQIGEHHVVGHGNSLYRESLQVPLFLWYPGHLPAGRRITPAVALRDLPATVADLSGLPGPWPFPGRSLSRFWHDSPPAGADTLLMEVDYNSRLPKGTPLDKGSMRSVLLDSLRYILNGDGREELYDIIQDVREDSDLAPRPEAATALEQRRDALTALGARVKAKP
jgi:arylsulfatase A-like enzyme